MQWSNEAVAALLGLARTNCLSERTDADLVREIEARAGGGPVRSEDVIAWANTLHRSALPEAGP